MDELSRRAFLKLAATGGAAMAAGMGIKSADKLIPYVVPPADVHPGTVSFYATTCRECPAGCGMHLWHRDGRVTKAEGNPASWINGGVTNPDPASPIRLGGLCPRGQSALQGLYDPDRIPTAQHRPKGGQIQDWPWGQAVEAIGQRLRKAGNKLAIISDLQTGALAEVMEQFLAVFRSQRLLIYEPFNYEPLRAAHAEVFGQATVPNYQLSQCDFVLSLSADFLETWVSPVQFMRDFSQVHSYRDGQVGRLAYVGPRQSMTAGNADELLLVPPGMERWVGLAMLRSMVSQGLVRANLDGVREFVSRLSASMPATIPGAPAGRIAELARAFAQAKASVALAGPTGAVGPVARDTAIVGALLNYAAGRVGHTVDFSRPHALSRTATSEQTQRFLANLSAEDTLIIHNANLAYTLPGSAEAIRRAGAVVYLGTMPDETAELAQWVLPIDSPLEAWGDYEPYAGIHGLVQPTMARMQETRLAGDIFLALAEVAGKPLSYMGLNKPPPATQPAHTPPADDPITTIPSALPGATTQPVAGFPEWLQQRWEDIGQRIAPSQGFASFWPEALRAGGAVEPVRGPRIVLRPELANVTFAPAASGAGESGVGELWAWPGIMLFDGRVSNRGWLQESPEPTSYITWINCVDLHPKLALSLGLHNGDLVELQSPAGKMAGPVPARITEDVVENLVAISFGQGHTAMGRHAAGRGGNAFQLLSAGGGEGMFGKVTVRKLGPGIQPAYASWTQNQYDRDKDILRWAPLAGIGKREAGEQEKFDLPLPEGYHSGRDVYPKREYLNHRWAMVIDVQRCTGCGACAVSCYAENNIPVMGEDEVHRGRELAWLKIVPYRETEDPRRLGWLPMLCQHCDAAPCEPVCPVFAAVHNEEGLNAQVYNRCLGTRYCSNNCPYKVRKFNWLNVKWVKPLDWQLNPEVTVRSRGVMEKCTFCIQRIRAGEHQAKRENRRVRDGDITPACAQSCPTGAIIFGDLLDGESRVSRLTRTDPRRYHVLEGLNAKPAITYLMRIKTEKP